MATIPNQELRRTAGTRRPIVTSSSVTPTLFIESSHVRRGIRVAVAGEIDLATAPQLEAELVSAVAAAHTFVEVDLADVTFLDSQGIAVLIRAKVSVGPSQQFRITSASYRARRVLDATGMWDVLANGAVRSPRRQTPETELLQLQRALTEAEDVYQYALERNRAAVSAGRSKPFGMGALQVMIKRVDTAQQALAGRGRVDAAADDDDVDVKA